MDSERRFQIDWSRWLFGLYVAPVEVLVFVGPIRWLVWVREKRWQEYRELFVEAPDGQ